MEMKTKYFCHLFPSTCRDGTDIINDDWKEELSDDQREEGGNVCTSVEGWQKCWVNNVLRPYSEGVWLGCYGYTSNMGYPTKVTHANRISITTQLSQDVINPAHGSLLRVNFPSIEAV
jgi:hypothetical protein